MKKFTLVYFIKKLKDNQTEVCLKPSDDLIDDYLATYKTYATHEEAIIDLQLFIDEQTSLMFDVFINCENIPQEIRNQFEL